MPVCRYHSAITRSILIRHLPDDVHAALQRRATAAGMSMQQYVLDELVRSATSPSMHEVLDRIDAGRDGRRGGRVGLAQAVGDLDESRP
jgi:antitoxin FitA